ncbi:ABC transporter ATP-binding protein [bacterium 1XD42-8]|nr:ABC transporter ATP-binding protein [bacterium 1XD42-8]
MIEIRNLIVEKGESVILKIPNASIDVSKGTAIFGENGAGKTTFVKCILGIERYKGTIESSICKNKIQVLMQKNSYPPYAKTKDILKLILDKRDLSSLSTLLHMFDFEKNLNKKIAVLSGGELQKLNLILAFSKSHQILIVDEVTTGLDYTTRWKLLNYIRDYRKNNNIGFIIVSHYPEEIKALCDNVICLKNGNLVSHCQVDTFFKNLKEDGEMYV